MIVLIFRFVGGGDTSPSFVVVRLREDTMSKRDLALGILAIDKIFFDDIDSPHRQAFAVCSVRF